MHTKTRYNYEKTDQKMIDNDQKWPKPKKYWQKDSFPLFAFSQWRYLQILLLLIFVQEWLLSHFFMVLQRAMADDDVTNTSFFRFIFLANITPVHFLMTTMWHRMS